jgi:hypothetical protein
MSVASIESSYDGSQRVKFTFKRGGPEVA